MPDNKVRGGGYSSSSYYDSRREEPRTSTSSSSRARDRRSASPGTQDLPRRRERDYDSRDAYASAPRTALPPQTAPYTPYQYSYDPVSPRTRDRHVDSEGESDSGNPHKLYRSLRPEERPRHDGLRPPVGHDPNKSARDHITAGSRAKVKSPYVSLTHSQKTAGAWAGQTGGRVATVDTYGLDKTDMSRREEARTVFPTLKGSSYYTATSSQEVVIRGGVGPERVTDVRHVRQVSPNTYSQASASTYPNFESKFMSRSQVSKDGKRTAPQPYIYTRHPDDYDGDY